MVSALGALGPWTIPKLRMGVSLLPSGAGAARYLLVGHYW